MGQLSKTLDLKIHIMQLDMFSICNAGFLLRRQAPRDNPDDIISLIFTGLLPMTIQLI